MLLLLLLLHYFTYAPYHARDKPISKRHQQNFSAVPQSVHTEYAALAAPIYCLQPPIPIPIPIRRQQPPVEHATRLLISPKSKAPPSHSHSPPMSPGYYCLPFPSAPSPTPSPPSDHQHHHLSSCQSPYNHPFRATSQTLSPRSSVPSSIRHLVGWGDDTS